MSMTSQSAEECCRKVSQMRVTLETKAQIVTKRDPRCLPPSKPAGTGTASGSGTSGAGSGSSGSLAVMLKTWGLGCRMLKMLPTGVGSISSFSVTTFGQNKPKHKNVCSGGCTHRAVAIYAQNPTSSFCPQACIG